MKRFLVFAYGVICYAVFFATFLYAVGFIGNLVVPKSMDSPASTPLMTALAIDLGLLALFAIQHSVMARPWFKRAWTRFVPEAAERSTYVLFSSVALIALFALWQPLGGMVWNVEEPIARGFLFALYGMGLGLVLFSTFLINHFDLFGLRQVWLQLVGRPYTHLAFKTPLLYKYVRHPLYVGWMMTFWFTPTMTVTHLVFAVMCTAYMLIAIRWEEKDLVEVHGAKYLEYRSNVPKFVPTSKPYETLTPREAVRRLA